MRQMVTEIHQGQPNLDQAVAKFEITRQTVWHWVEIVEEEAETASQATAEAPLRAAVKKKAPSRRYVEEDSDEVKVLKEQLRSVQRDLETANRVGGPIGFSRQAYYQYWPRQAAEAGQDVVVIRLAKALRKEHPQMGGRKLYDRLREELRKEGIKLGRDGSPLRHAV